MSRIHSTARNAIPGDIVRVMTARAWDEAGNEHPAGTEFTPIRAGQNNIKNRAEQIVSIDGREIVFVS